jgi:hypothetical protein
MIVCGSECCRMRLSASGPFSGARLGTCARHGAAFAGAASAELRSRGPGSGRSRDVPVLRHPDGARKVRVDAGCDPQLHSRGQSAYSPLAGRGGQGDGASWRPRISCEALGALDLPILACAAKTHPRSSGRVSNYYERCLPPRSLEVITARQLASSAAKRQTIGRTFGTDKVAPAASLTMSNGRPSWP